MQRTAHIALAILKIHVHVLCHTHMPKPQANNTLGTNKVPATAPCSAHTHTVGLLLPPTMPPGVQSKCHPREKGLSAGAASEEAPTILLGPVEACMYARTHARARTTRETYLKSHCAPFQGNMLFDPEKAEKQYCAPFSD